MDIQTVKQRFGVIGNTYELNRALDIAIQVAPTDLSVLIVGESGVGKEIFPQVIHAASTRKHNKYVPVNCGAIPEGTIESELFGHKKGSFTDAQGERKGYFEEANGGTIFLDEVGELPLSTQVRLLRVLETGEFMKVGSSKIQKTNVRVVAATNINMEQAIKTGRFREDLFYRLNTVPINVPPLRERPEDIPLLFKKFANDFATRYRMPSIKLSTEANHHLISYRWPGNIRQLKNVTEQISVIEKERTIEAAVLASYIPHVGEGLLPALFEDPLKVEGAKVPNQDLIYQVLFDMKKDVTDLKKLVNSLIENGTLDISQLEDKSLSLINNYNFDTHTTSSVQDLHKPSTLAVNHRFNNNQLDIIEDTEEYVEESLSLIEQEIILIKKALNKHKGKRKQAAKDLGISERTLYRKIKEYGLEV